MNRFCHFFLIDRVNSKSEDVKGISPEGIGVPKARKPLTSGSFLNYNFDVKEMQNLRESFKPETIKFSNAQKLTFLVNQYKECVKCCQKKFPSATPDPTGACATKRAECIANCIDVTAGVYVQPPQEDGSGQK